MAVKYRLKELMKESKLSAPKLANASGVPLPSIKSILNGQSKNPKATTLIALSNALDCMISDLLSEHMKDVGETNNEIVNDNASISADIIYLSILKLIDDIAMKKDIDISNNRKLKKKCADRIFTYVSSESHETIDPVYVEWVLDSELKK